MTMDEYRANLKAAYDPATSKDEQKKILEAFLKFKSETINHRDGCPKEAEDAISHLQQQTFSQRWYSSFLEHPLISTVIGGVFVLIFWHYIAPFFGSKG